MTTPWLTYLVSSLQEMHDVHKLKQLVEKETGPKELPPNLQSSTLLEGPLMRVKSLRRSCFVIFFPLISTILEEKRVEEANFA
jgi:hypothetical protein